MSIDITPELRVDPNGSRIWRVVQSADDLVVGEIVEEGAGKFTRYGRSFSYRVATFTTLAAAATLGEES